MCNMYVGILRSITLKEGIDQGRHKQHIIFNHAHTEILHSVTTSKLSTHTDRQSQSHIIMGNETESHTAAAPEPVLLASLRAPTPNARVHALPCTIEHDGPAAIRTYFMPRKVQAQENHDNNKKEKTATSGDVKGVLRCV